MRKIVIDPRVIKHLGRDLITSPEVAIIELIKNSIDAKASHINLRLYNSMPSNGLIPDCVSDSVPNKYLASPILVVEDDGCGMTDATIDGGFLKIATDIKSNEESTLGEKGIGRLAAQRLGTALLVETSSDKENHTSYVFIDWNAVINGEKTTLFKVAAYGSIINMLFLSKTATGTFRGNWIKSEVSIRSLKLLLSRRAHMMNSSMNVSKV